MPTTPARARMLLQKGKAVVARFHPFSIRLKQRVGGATQPLTLTLDPGSKITGLALSRVQGGQRFALWLGELVHRAPIIKKALLQRSNYRRGRRLRNLRYRASRFSNRTKPKNWLVPSLRHRVETTVSQVKRLRALAPITGLAQEMILFDLQLVAAATSPLASRTRDAEKATSLDYQEGTLQGFEVCEYLLTKWDSGCAYCEAKGLPLQVDYVIPRAKGGSSRVKNLTLACDPCLKKKGARSTVTFLAKDPIRLKRVLAKAKSCVVAPVIVNVTRLALFEAMQATGLPVEVASGGRTTWNRFRLSIPKTHALSALCVGEFESIANWRLPTLVIRAMGRGSYQRTLVTASGFPRGYLMRQKTVHGFRTGDLVKAVLPKGKHAGVQVGRVAARANGKFNLQTRDKVMQSIWHSRCKVLMRGDGYGYEVSKPVPVPAKETKSGIIRL